MYIQAGTRINVTNKVWRRGALDPLFTLFLHPFWWLKNGSGENVGVQNCFIENIGAIRVVRHLSKAALWLASSPEQ